MLCSCLSVVREYTDGVSISWDCQTFLIFVCPAFSVSTRRVSRAVVTSDIVELETGPLGGR